MTLLKNPSKFVVIADTTTLPLEPVPFDTNTLSDIKSADVIDAAAPVIIFCLVPIDVDIFVAKFGSFPNAVANVFKVSNVPGAPSTKLAIAVSTSDFV